MLGRERCGTDASLHHQAMVTIGQQHRSYRATSQAKSSTIGEFRGTSMAVICQALTNLLQAGHYLADGAGICGGLRTLVSLPVKGRAHLTQ